MENIKDYANTKTCIKVSNKQQFLKLMPLLNTIFRGWDERSYTSHTHDEERVAYISLEDDSISEKVYAGYNCMDVSEFVEVPPPEEVKPLEKLPEKWYIENKYQAVRDWIALNYDFEEMKDWVTYKYIGYVGGSAHRGFVGAPKSYFYERGCTLLSIEQFSAFVLNELINSTKKV